MQTETETTKELSCNKFTEFIYYILVKYPLQTINYRNYIVPLLTDRNVISLYQVQYKNMKAANDYNGQNVITPSALDVHRMHQVSEIKAYGDK